MSPSYRSTNFARRLIGRQRLLSWRYRAAQVSCSCAIAACAAGLCRRVRPHKGSTTFRLAEPHPTTRVEALDGSCQRVVPQGAGPAARFAKPVVVCARACQQRHCAVTLLVDDGAWVTTGSYAPNAGATTESPTSATSAATTLSVMLMSSSQAALGHVG